MLRRAVIGVVVLLCAWPASAQLPNRRTPGVATGLSQSVVCSTKWGKDTRHVTLGMKKQVFAAYGIPWSQRYGYELDHLISRELGGADAIDNLWPQPLTGPWNAYQKDLTENATHRAMCRGEISLSDAQHQIAKDWTVLYRRLVTKQ